MRYLFINIIKLYQYFVSPLLGNQCRFYPSCSYYSQDAIQRHGVLKGLCYTVIRLLKCHPFCKGGVDPVPKKFGS